MCYHPFDHIIADPEFIKKMTNTFLIRDPEKTVLSNYVMNPDITSEEIGIELEYNLSGGTENTLASVIDKTSTAMGSRCLRRWINRPLRDQASLSLRHNAIENLLEHRSYVTLQESLRNIGDIERILTRVAIKSARPRDLYTLGQSLAALPEIQSQLVDHLP